MTTYTSHNGFNERLNVNSEQAVAMPAGYRHETQSTPSTSAPAWGGQFTVKLSQKNIDLTKLTLEFQMPAISGLTVTNSGTAAYSSCFFWFTRIDVYAGSTCIDSITPLSNFLNKQLFTSGDERRSLMNIAAGLYTTHATRATKSASSGYWYLPLYTAFNTSNFPVLAGMPDIELRITMDTLANSYTLTSGSTATGTVTGSITAVNLLTRQSKLPDSVVSYHNNILRRSPLHFPFLESRTQSFTVSSGVSTTSLVLSGLVGLVPFFVFTVRSTTVSGSGAWAWDTTLSQFELLSGGSESLVGGAPIKDLQSRLVMSAEWVNTTFISDGAGVYLYPWTKHPTEVRNSGANLTARTMTGTEVLKLTWTSTLAAAVQVDVYAPAHAALELTPGNVKKISLSAA